MRISMKNVYILFQILFHYSLLRDTWFPVPRSRSLLLYPGQLQRMAEFMLVEC